MGFDAERECTLCFILNGHEEPSPEEKDWKRFVCTHCLERCGRESGWAERRLPYRVLFGLKVPVTDELCVVCSKTQILLFQLIVCDAHCDHFVETKEELDDVPELPHSSQKQGLRTSTPETVFIPATHVNPTEPLDYSEEDKELAPLSFDAAVSLSRIVQEEESKLEAAQPTKQSNGLTRAQSAALHLLAEEVSGQLQAAAKRIVSSAQ
jgi:hypothetical protein